MVMKRKDVIPAALLVLFLTILSVPQIQGESPGAGPQTPPNSVLAASDSTDREIWNAIEALRETRLIKELALSADRAAQILEKIRTAKKIRQRYLLQRQQIETKLDALIEIPHPDQTGLSAALKELETVKAQSYQLALTADQELWTLLSPEEQAKYVLFQKNFNKQLKEIIAAIRQQRAAPPSQNLLLRRQDGESVIRDPRE